ncbi:MAG: magnesium/cobalt transporter CorA [Candidatus Margulisiibacteriota bacterium]
MKITVFNYNEKSFEEKTVSLDEGIRSKNLPGVTWINLDGFPDAPSAEKLCQDFGWHQLILENLLDTTQRPKIEDFGTHCYIVLKMLSYEKDKLTVEQVTFVVGANYVVTLQEKEFKGDAFDPVRKRIRSGYSRLRKSGTDYLTYRLIDAIVDYYFSVMEQMGDKIEKAEIETINHPGRASLSLIQKLRKEMIYLRKVIWPAREVLNSMQRGESPLIKEETRRYLRDVYDHAVQVIDTIETYRDMLALMLEIYLSSISNRLNEIMKTLTIFSALFMPLTFLVGLYGMNFKYLPEFEWRYGYPMVWVIIILTVIGMLMFFRRRKWI